jgi:hypothetical protein
MITRCRIIPFVILAAICGCTSEPNNTQPEGATNSKTQTIANQLIRVKVLAENGEPIDDVEVATFWSANGQQWNDDGSCSDLENASDDVVSEAWDDEGKMVALPIRRALHLGDGIFEIKTSRERPHMVLAINKQQTLGGVAFAPRQLAEQLCIRLEPLVRVVGEIRCDGEIPDWTYTSLYSGTLKQTPD